MWKLRGRCGALVLVKVLRKRDRARSDRRRCWEVLADEKGTGGWHREAGGEAHWRGRSVMLASGSARVPRAVPAQRGREEETERTGEQRKRESF